jgi:hypothetical protein
MNRSFVVFTVVVALATLATAGDFPVAFRQGAYAFHGHYPGHCGNDGFYYRDHYSFVICSNGNAYDQPCAPGTRNSEYGHYDHGHDYRYRDFCDVNLVDYGFGAHYDPRRYDLYPVGYGHGHPVVPVVPHVDAIVPHRY